MRILSTKKIIAGAMAMLAAGVPAGATQVGSFRYQPDANVISGNGVALPIMGNFGTMTIEGADPSSSAWRTDGFTSIASGHIGNILNSRTMSATLRFAIDTYPIIGHERAEISNNNIQVELAGCLNEGAKSGFAFSMGRTGKFSAQVYVGGSLVNVQGNGIIPLWEWTELTVVVDGTSVRLYKNGVEVGSSSAPSEGVKVGDANMYFALGSRHDSLGGAEICGINGAYESLVINDTPEVSPFSPAYADLGIPSSRYANDRFRARFHGMPGQNWTNETHGLYYNSKDGKYHAFFQRTGSAPIMSHQHWGHIVSDDLITWRDDKPVLAPSEPYDIKGCWSGCVFSDPAFNGGNPTIIYTGVDFAKPYVATAYCDDPVNMRQWHKDPSNPLDVFGDIGDGRDTYFYRDGENAYFLIGSKDAVHYYKWDGGRWNYKGEFYHTEDGVDNGHNTEMPNVTNMGSGKWMMTTSPLAGKYGTTCLYRVGSLSDGKFVNYGEAKKVDLFGIQGYGLLSPSVSTTPDGRIVAMGIVPDKMPTQVNIDLGYAHLYSLPREWRLQDGELYQSPAREIYRYRDLNSLFTLDDVELEGARSLETVRGRAAEVNATFVVGNSPFGINFLKNSKGKCAKLVYNPANGELKLDFGGLPRLQDDMNINCFSSVLPERPAEGEEMNIHLFIDRSIVDIFINDHYAASVRVYPTDNASDLIEVFADGKTTLRNVEAYLLGEGGDTYGSPVVPAKPEKLETTGRVALYVGYDNLEDLTKEDQHIDLHEEKAVYDYFVSKFPTGTVLFAGDADKIKASDFDCVWVACDRPGIEQGWRNLPEAFSNDKFVNVLKEYTAAGGNLYLTKFAGQLVNAIGRCQDEPTVFYSGEGTVKDDEWSMQCIPYGDLTDTSIFNGLSGIRDDGYAKVLPLMSGTQLRDDHNCLWDLNQCGGADSFMARNNAEILGTWGHNGGENGAGFVEFRPAQTRSTDPEVLKQRKGTIIVNGLAAYEWAQIDGVNESFQNIMDLTTNVIMYLSPVAEGGTGVEPGEDPEIPEPIVTPEPAPEVLESTNRVALYLGYDNLEELLADDKNEDMHEAKAAYDFFSQYFPEGKILFAGDAEQIKIEDFDCVWVTCDRPGIDAGWRNLPEAYSNDRFIEIIKTFNAQGGNLYLSKFATQLVNAIGRTDEEPNVFSSGEGSFKDDVWSMNIVHFGNDWKSHAIFTDLPAYDVNYGTLIDLMSGAHHRDDHNCLWDVNNEGGSFMDRNNARILGTWGHEGGHAGAGLVEFLPAQTRATNPEEIAKRKGTIIVNGLAAYEWAQTGGKNESHENIVKLTSNILKYLSPVEDLETGSFDLTPEPMGEEMWFNLQGQRVTSPDRGIYIRVKAGKAVKVIF
ncbi:MAG: DUF4960 domain-containing protein [Muribaculaceae bacterium]|nr:DUF4960 domain-containing protein [Muribaculaceae bacterium]